MIISIPVAIAVCIKRKKSAILQANPVKSDASALYDIDLDKSDEHIYDDIALTRTHIYEVINDNIETCEPQELDDTDTYERIPDVDIAQLVDDSKGKDTYERVPDVDIARLLDDSKGKDTYERVPDVDIARLLDDSKGKDTYERVPHVDIARLLDDSKGKDTYEQAPDVDIGRAVERKS